MGAASAGHGPARIASGYQNAAAMKHFVIILRAIPLASGGGGVRYTAHIESLGWAGAPREERPT
jgi:hypothetical protein